MIEDFKKNMKDYEAQDLRALPSIDKLLSAMPEAIRTWGHTQVVHSLRDHLNDLRIEIMSGGKPDVSIDNIKCSIVKALDLENRNTLIPVFNLTGTVLHTNLGRATLSKEAIRAINRVTSSASTLEFDLETGSRGNRESHVERLLCKITGAEAATVVNNNAAAMILVLNSLALGKKVPVSRGELVEIGGSFRVPEIMERAGCNLTEIGTTNRTHVEDYQKAISDDTALIMKVHTSNYRIHGFTSSVPEPDLVSVARRCEIPLVIDLGSGNLVDFASLGLPDEPTVQEVIKTGADLVTFSGDKLLGGPQAGLIAGRADLIEKLKINPLKRALRMDKMSLAALSETLKLYKNPETLTDQLPTLRLLTRKPREMRQQAKSLLPILASALGEKYDSTIEKTNSQIGSGTLPVEKLPSIAIKIRPVSDKESEIRFLIKRFRQLPRPILGRLNNHALWLDLRCLELNEEPEFTSQLKELKL